MTETVGFLWDSLTPNIGDQAIGLVFLRLVKNSGFEQCVPVNLGQPYAEEHALLVIGGGELLTDPGHAYYDAFRVPGQHVLCSAGTSGPLPDVSFLNRYRLVSVRSRWDQENLLALEREVRIAPCLTVLYPDVARFSDSWFTPPAGTLGLHLNAASVTEHAPRLIEQLHQLDLDSAAFFSFTRYNADARFQKVLTEALGLRAPWIPEGPDEAFHLIRHLRAVIVTSLHATIFAYVTGVPFLSFGYSPKVSAFLDERGLGDRVVTRFEDVKTKRDLLDPASVSWSAQLEQDQRRANELLDDILAVADQALESGGVNKTVVGWREPSHPIHAHRIMLEHYMEFGSRVADQAAFELEQDRVRRHLEETGRELTTVHDALDTAERYARHVESELGHVQGEAQRLIQHTERLTERIQHAESERSDLEGRVAGVDQEIDRLRKELDQEHQVSRQTRRDTSSHKEALSRIQEELSLLGQEIHERDREIQQRDREIAQLSQEVRRLQERRTEDQSLLQVTRQRIDELRRADKRRSQRMVYVVIVHHRGQNILHRCLESLLDSKGPVVEVVVIANHCQEPLPDLVETSEHIHVVETSSSLGFSAANNLGVHWATEHLGLPDFYFFLNNDTVIEDNTIRNLVLSIDRDPTCGIIGPLLKIWGAPEYLNSLGLQVTRYGDAWDEGIGRSLKDYGDMPHRRPVLGVTGSALMIRADLFHDLKGWEEIYDYYYEDIDLCLRCWSKGWRVIHEPEAIMYHAISATAEDRSPFKLNLTWRNRFLLMLIHWPTTTLLRMGPTLLAREVRLLYQRWRAGALDDAKLQIRAWGGVLVKFVPALVRRLRTGHRKRWITFLRAPDAIPEIRLPEASVRGTLAAQDPKEEATQ